MDADERKKMVNPAAKTQNEAALACAARRGDREALRELLERNWLWLKGLTYNILGNLDDVDEAMQNLCVIVIEKIGTLREPERFKAWLATVARHAALAYRQQRSQRPVTVEELASVERPDPTAGHPADKLARQEQQRQLLDAIEQLPEKYREVFIMKHVQDISYADIAEALDIPVTTVQIRLVRARRMLANHLTGRPNEKVPRT
jgi:RNA polymerase sigma-70 factor, ECF subfamily